MCRNYLLDTIASMRLSSSFVRSSAVASGLVVFGATFSGVFTGIVFVGVFVGVAGGVFVMTSLLTTGFSAVLIGVVVQAVRMSKQDVMRSIFFIGVTSIVRSRFLTGSDI